LDSFLIVHALDIFRADPVAAKINRKDAILGHVVMPGGGASCCRPTGLKD
jgi:hypothetical protein